MNNELFEWGDAFASSTDPQTSHDAAHAVEGEEANRMEHIVLKAIASAPNGLNNHEIVAVTGLTWNTATPRVRPLVNKGLVMDSGERRMGPRGKKCVVWKVVR